MIFDNPAVFFYEYQRCVRTSTLCSRTFAFAESKYFLMDRCFPHLTLLYLIAFAYK